MVSAILYRLKTGCQWRELPVKHFFKVKYGWQSVYYHYRKWSMDGSWEKVWNKPVHKYAGSLELSCTAPIHRLKEEANR
ncbi:transposase [Thermonema rossianum]|uniref:transposase n=1 Tax=Thermonema rossianum TaxID=55505 RepID=UPI000A062476